MCRIASGQEPTSHVYLTLSVYTIYVMIQSKVKTLNKTKKKNEAAEQLKLEDSADLPLSC